MGSNFYLFCMFWKLLAVLNEFYSKLNIEAAEKKSILFGCSWHPAEMAGVALPIEGLYTAEINLGQPLELRVSTGKTKAEFAPWGELFTK